MLSYASVGSKNTFPHISNSSDNMSYSPKPGHEVKINIYLTQFSVEEFRKCIFFGEFRGVKNRV